MDCHTANRRRLAIHLLLVSLVLFVVTNLAPPVLSPRVAHIIILTFDGTRADTFTRLLPRMPAVAELVRAGAAGEGTRTLYARTPEGHAVIFSGAAPEVFNFSVPSTGLSVETLFDVTTGSGRRSLFVDGKAGRLKGLERSASVILNTTDYVSLPQSRGSLAPVEAFWAQFEKDRPALGFCLLPLPDSNGHAYGHDSKEYEDAIAGAGEAVGWLRDHLKAAGVADRTLIVITADHGMTGSGHSGTETTNYLVPLVLSGPGVRPGAQVREATTADIAPTVAVLGGLRRPRGATGRVLMDALTPRARMAVEAGRAAPFLNGLAAALLAAAGALALAAARSGRSGRSGRASPKS